MTSWAFSYLLKELWIWFTCYYVLSTKVQWGRESWPYSSWYNIYNQCLSQLMFLCYLRQVFFSLFTYSSFLQQKTDLHNITEMFLKLMLKLPIILILSQMFSSRENWVNLRSVQVIIYCAHVFSQHGCSNTLQTFFFFTIKCLKNQLCVLPPPPLAVLKYPLN